MQLAVKLGLETLALFLINETESVGLSGALGKHR